MASLAVIALCQYGRPKRRASSSPTQAASALGSIVVQPRAICARTASTTGGLAWPNMAPVSPRQKSTRSWPSTSVTCAPLAFATCSAKGVDQSFIQCSGEPNSQCCALRSASACERGLAAMKRSRSVAAKRAR